MICKGPPPKNAGIDGDVFKRTNICEVEEEMLLNIKWELEVCEVTI